MTRTIELTLLAGALGALVLAAPADAARGHGAGHRQGARHGQGGGPGGPAGPSIQRADADGDGTVSRAEFLAAAAERIEHRMQRLDENRDGALSADELPSGRRATARVERADANGDGVISAVEAERAASKVFDRLDRDGDGALTRDELRSGRVGKGRRGSLGSLGRNGARGEPGARGGGTVSEDDWMARNGLFERLDDDGDGVVELSGLLAGEPSSPRATRIAGRLEAADGNGDGRLTRSEWEAARAALFDAADANDDGRVTPAERRALR